MREAAAPLLAEHAESMRVVDHQPGVEAFGEFKQSGQRGQIAVHAEHGVRQNHLAPGAAAGEQTFECVQIAVRIALVVGPRELNGIDQRGMVELVGKYGISTPCLLYTSRCV